MGQYGNIAINHQSVRLRMLFTLLVKPRRAFSLFTSYVQNGPHGTLPFLCVLALAERALHPGARDGASRGGGSGVRSCVRLKARSHEET